MLIDFKTLFPKYNLHPSGILHLGANTGQEAETYDELGIKRVVWVEALKQVHRKLANHISRFPQHVALEACVSDKDGDWVQFHIASNQAQSSSFLEFGTHAQEHPTVKYIGQIPMQTITVESLLKKYSIQLTDNSWFLNADLQGAELLALKGMGNLLRHFSAVYLEVNKKELYKGCALVGEVDKYLELQGFVPKETYWTDHGWGDRFFLRS